MNIRRRGPNLWQCVWLVSKDPTSGRWKKRYETVEGTQAQAEAYWYKIRRELDRGTAIEPSEITVGEWLEQWLALRKEQIRPQTWERYRGLIRNHLIPTLGSTKLQDLRAPAVQAALARWRTTPRGDGKPGAISSRSVRYCLQLLQASLDQAVKWQLIDRNVAALVSPPRLDPISRSWWSPDEARHFLAATANTRWGLVWRLALMTGLRRGEILGLQWTDINWEARTLTVRRTMNRHNEAGPPKTIQGRRTVALDKETLDALRNAHEQTPGNTWVFSTRSGTPINGRNLSRAYYQAIIQSGVPSIRFHDLRHTHASLLLAEGENLRVIADRLGHSQVSFTAQTYTHAATEAQREKAEALAKRLRQNCGRTDQNPPSEDSGHS